MPQAPEPPVKHRVRAVRRRITAAVLATFGAAWRAVAALGKGGATSAATTSGSPATGTSSQSDDGAGSAQGGDSSQSDGFGTPQSSEGSGDDGLGSSQGETGPSAGANPDSSQSGAQQGGPVTTGQS
jgi:hypothetical protein